MTKIYPEGVEATPESTPLEIDDKKRAELVAKAKELLVEPMEPKELCDALEQFYVASNIHYTSAQLKDVVDQVATDLAPEPAEIAEEV